MSDLCDLACWEFYFPFYSYPFFTLTAGLWVNSFKCLPFPPVKGGLFRAAGHCWVTPAPLGSLVEKASTAVLECCLANARSQYNVSGVPWCNKPSSHHLRCCSGLPVTGVNDNCLDCRHHSFPSKNLGCVASPAGVICPESFSGTALTVCFSPKSRPALSHRSLCKRTYHRLHLRFCWL